MRIFAHKLQGAHDNAGTGMLHSVEPKKKSDEIDAHRFEKRVKRKIV